MRKFFVAFALCVGIIAGARAENNCTGATYYDADTDTCVACPGGYDYNTDSGKTDITQCQIHCDAGTYIETAGIALPGEYTMLEYIESTGTQYIDTGIVADNTTEAEVDFMDFVGSSYLFFTTNGSWSSRNFGIIINDYLRFYMNCDGSTTYTRPSGTNVSGNIKLLTTGIFLNDTQLSINRGQIPSSTAFTTTYPIVLFGRNSAGTPSAAAKVKIRYFKLWKNHELVRDFIPVRRNSDGVLGMYDTVSNTFFTNAGTGEFIAGPDVGGACVNVGAGYWAAASTVNFDSVGTRTACPAGTYSNNPNATSINDCAPCVGATYNDTIAASACKSCPNGYDYNTDPGKTDITQCQIHCEAGTWIGEYTQLEYIESTGTQYIDTGYIPNQSSGVKTKVRLNSVDNNKAMVFGSAQAYNSKAFELYLWDGSPEFNYNDQWKVTGNNISVDNVLELDWNKNIVNYSINNVQQQTINFTAGAFVAPYTMNIFAIHRPGGAVPGLVGIYYFKIYDNGTLVHDMIPVRRNVDGVLGMYDKVSRTFFTNAGTGEFIAGPNVVGCVDVGAGYWAAASTVNFGDDGARNACPVGTTTVGYGHGADSANDCGRVLHIGDYVLYARRDRVTSPSLNIRIPEEGIIYYINLGSENHDLSRLHLMLDGVQYTAYDDSLYYGERDFDTGEQIVQ